jgi:hypothetical protein
MRDAELVLRFFALKDSWKNYAGGLKKILDSFMDDNQTMAQTKVDEIAQEFTETLEKVQAIFGADGSFRRWIPENKKWKQQVSAPLFDAQMFACYKKNKKKLEDSKTKILSDFKKLFTSDKEFLQSIESSTATPNRFLYRTNKLNEILNNNI